MDIAISVLIDVVLVAILILFTVMGVRKGMLKSVIKFGGGIIAVIIAVSFSAQLGAVINDKAIEKPVREWLVNQLTSDPADVDSSEEDVDFEALFKDEPEFFKDLCSYLSVQVDSLKQAYNEHLSSGVEKAKTEVINSMAKPLAQSVSRVIAFVVLFVACWIVIGIIRLIVSIFLKLPVLSHLDKLGGGIFGFLGGIIVCLVVVAVIQMSSPYVLKDRTLAQKNAILDNTYVYKVFEIVNPFDFKD